jgi:hypothetical protein
MWRDLAEDVREMWQCTTPLERVGVVLFVPIYAVAFVLAYVFGED